MHAVSVNVCGLYRGWSECQSNELVWPPRATGEEPDSKECVHQGVAHK